MDLIIALILEYRYPIIVPAVVLIGPPVSLIAGIFLRLEILHIIPTILALAAGELGSDVLWYWLGKRYGDSFVQKFGKYVGITERSVAYVKQLFDSHHDIIIFTSKLTSGLGFGTVVMFTAGMSRVPFRRYMMLNIAGQFLWSAGLLSIGYFFGHVFLQVNSIFEKMALFALAIIVFASLIGFARYLRAYILP